MEVLSDILRTMQVEGSVYFCDNLEAPWRKEFTDTEAAAFHMVRRGECWATAGDETVQLGPGDLVFLAPGLDHVLVSHPPGADPSAHSSSTWLLCGYANFSADAVTPLAGIFPTIAIIREDELTRHAWLKATLDQLSSEYLAQGPGSELIVNKLTEVVLIELIRINFCRDEDNSFLVALNDPVVSKALNLLHERPQQPWTLDSLAAEVALSRAAFAKRFKSMVGQSMFQYLTLLRMQKARDLIITTQLPVYEISSRSGYESELAFTRTFKKHAGITPKQFLKQSGPADVG